MASISRCTLMKRLSPSLKKIYFACGRIEFLRLVQQEHGEKMSRFLGELDIDSAQCLINIDLISIIEDDEKFLSKESRDYLFTDGTKKIRPMIQHNIQRFVDQMKQLAIYEKHQQLTDNNTSLSSSSDLTEYPTKRKRLCHGRTIKHRLESSRKDDSFSSGAYELYSSVSIKESNSDEQLEHQITTTRRIDYFLTQYCLVSTVDLSMTKIRLLHHLRIHEEQLYEILMYLRNTFGDTLKENLDKNQLSTSLLKMLGSFKPVGYYRM